MASILFVFRCYYYSAVIIGYYPEVYVILRPQALPPAAALIARGVLLRQTGRPLVSSTKERGSICGSRDRERHRKVGSYRGGSPVQVSHLTRLPVARDRRKVGQTRERETSDVLPLARLLKASKAALRFESRSSLHTHSERAHWCPADDMDQQKRR